MLWTNKEGCFSSRGVRRENTGWLNGKSSVKAKRKEGWVLKTLGR
jgi:hypothetical protein